MKTQREFVELDNSIHDCSGFDCDNDLLNEFLRTRASEQHASGISHTKVLPGFAQVEQGLLPLDAYYTTSIAAVELERGALPTEQSPQPYPLPVLLIKQLAVANRQQGRGLGKITLICVLRQLLSLSKQSQAVAVVADPLDANADRFYRDAGFLDMHDQGGRLFMPMQTVAALFSEQG